MIIYVNTETETLPSQSLKIFYNYMKYSEYYSSLLLNRRMLLVISYVEWQYLTTFVKSSVNILKIRSIIIGIIYHRYVVC